MESDTASLSTLSGSSLEVRYTPLRTLKMDVATKESWLFPSLVIGIAVALGPALMKPALSWDFRENIALPWLVGGVVFILVLAAIFAWRFRVLCLDKSGMIRIDETGLWLPGRKDKKDELIAFPWKDLVAVDGFKGTNELLHFQFTDQVRSKDRAGLLDIWGAKGHRNGIVLDMRALPQRDHGRVLTAVRRYAPPGRVNKTLKVQQSSDASYTQLWLEALDASPRRFAHAALDAGTYLDDHRYEIVRRIATGGQATTYEAIDHVADLSAGEPQRVVLKEFIVPTHGERAAVQEMFNDIELVAQMLERLACENIVQLYRVFFEDLRVCLVVEFIEGKTLRELVEQAGAVDEMQVIELAKQMCTILERLHGLTPPVVHRDFTPDNLMLTPQGVVKLIDFDVATSEERSSTSKVVGKPSYLAPEQFRGQPTTSSDLYSMGASLFFILTGKDPTPIAISHPCKTNDKVSQKLDSLVAGLTASTPAGRPGSAGEVRNSLQEIAAEEETP